MSNHDARTATRQRMAHTGENYTTARRALQEGAPEPGFLPEAARTTAPEVLAALHLRSIVFRLWNERRGEFAQRITSDTSVYTRPDTFSNATEMTALASDRPIGHGRWKAGPKGLGWVPAKGNPLGDEFETLISAPLVSVPGMPDAVHAGNRIYRVTPYEHDGAAWVRFARNPLDGLTLDHADRASLFRHPWASARPSEALAAAEAWNEQHAGTTRPPLTDAEREAAQHALARMEREREERRVRMRTALDL